MSFPLKKTIKFLMVSILIPFSSLILQAEDAKLSFAVNEVAPGLYMLQGVGGFTGGNIGLSVGDEGVVIIDDSMPPMLGIMNDAIKSVTDKPIDFLINTHLHADHTGNNETLGKLGTWIVGHKNLRQRMVDQGIDTSDGKVATPKAALPMLTFSYSMNFHLNGYDAKIMHLSRAHTDGDSIIYYEKANVIHTGDVMFNGLFPYIDLSNGGSIHGYIRGQKKILSLTNTTTKIIPGHGPLATKADLEKSIAMLEDSKKIIAALIEKGQTEEQVVKAEPLKKYHDDWNWGFITTEKMTKQVYQSLTQTNEHKYEHSPDSDHNHKEIHKKMHKEHKH